jgi:hypothetical protein
VSPGTRQREVAVTVPGNDDGACAECPQSDTRQRLTHCRVSIILTLGKEAPRWPFTKSFAERIRWHSAKAPSLSSARRTSTRQKGSPAGLFVISFAECVRRHSIKVASLPSAMATTLGKEVLSVPRCAFFAVCYNLDTRQSISFVECYTRQSN